MMYSMYKVSRATLPVASLAQYKQVLDSKALEFETAKATSCGVCSQYVDSREYVDFQSHLANEKAVRDCKEAQNLDATCCTAIFEQLHNIYLPSNIPGALYSHRLPCYVFSISELLTNRTYIYFWHQSVANQTSTASHVYNFLTKTSELGFKRVVLFCKKKHQDATLAAMLAYATHNLGFDEIVVYTYLHHHEGSNMDVLQQKIIKSIRQAGPLFIPDQILPILNAMNTNTTRHPIVIDVDDESPVKDWDQFAADLCFSSNINWKNLHALKVVKQVEGDICFLTNTSSIGETWETNTVLESLVIATGPNVSCSELVKLSSEIYSDLKELCSGPDAVVQKNRYKQFYEQLHH